MATRLTCLLLSVFAAGCDSKVGWIAGSIVVGVLAIVGWISDARDKQRAKIQAQEMENWRRDNPEEYRRQEAESQAEAQRAAQRREEDRLEMIRKMPREQLLEYRAACDALTRQILRDQSFDHQYRRLVQEADEELRRREG